MKSIINSGLLLCAALFMPCPVMDTFAQSKLTLGNLGYAITNGQIVVIDYKAPDDVVFYGAEIPSQIGGLPVTSIGDDAFSYCYFLTNVVIPDSVTSIGRRAFLGCCFLSSQVITDSVTNLDDSSFAGCEGLTEMVIPDSITSIGMQVFSGCTGLTNIVIPNSVTNIGVQAFANCSSLTSVTVPDEVICVRDLAFHGCSSLTEVVIGSHIGTIGCGAFGLCNNLVSAYFRGNAPKALDDLFWGIDMTIYHLAGKTGWEEISYGHPVAIYGPPAQIGVGIRDGQFGFTVAGVENSTVVVEACTDQAAGVWTALQTNTIIGGSFYFADSDWANYPSRFYRLCSP